MAPKKKGAAKKMRGQSFGPLDSSTICSENRLTLVREVIAGENNEHPATDIRPGGLMAAQRTPLMKPVYLEAVMAGLVPPFSLFFLAILEHYGILALHLQLNSFTTLAVFAYTCEAFLGVRPSVALFRHFYSLERSAGAHVIGSLRFRIARAFLKGKVSKHQDSFRRH